VKKTFRNLFIYLFINKQPMMAGQGMKRSFRN